MGPADIVIMYLSVDHGGINVRMTQEPLDLLDRHSILQEHGGNGMAEDVRRDPDRERAA